MLQEQVLFDYETTIYEAAEEVENALYDLAGEHERIWHPEVAARSAKEAADAALKQYEAPCCSRFIEYPPSASGS